MRRLACPLALLLWAFASTAMAQPLPAASLDVSAGLEFRGPGQVQPCCFAGAAIDTRSLWLGATVNRRVSERLALDAHLSWTSQDFESVSAAVPRFGGGVASNSISAVTIAGLVRSRVFHDHIASVDWVAGAGVTRETARSEVRPNPRVRPSVTGPGTSPPIEIGTARNLFPLIIGLDAARGPKKAAIVASVRLLVFAGGSDPGYELNRSRIALRIGAGVRSSF